MQTRISFFPLGYADQRGPTAIIVHGDLNREQAQRRLGELGYATAKVAWVSPVSLRPVSIPVTEEQARAYSARDNS